MAIFYFSDHLQLNIHLKPQNVVILLTNSIISMAKYKKARNFRA